MPVLLLTLGLAIAGCGGSSSESSQSTGAPASHSAPSPTHQTAPSSTAPAQRHAPVSGSTAAIIHQCAAKAAGNPAPLEICLAGHGVSEHAAGGMYSCLESASSGSDVTTCLTRYAG